jgi:CheY-like chemotaxis protein
VELVPHKRGERRSGTVPRRKNRGLRSLALLGTALAVNTQVLRFLVVDNDPATVSAMSQLFRGDGHEVEPFTAGAEAVKALGRGSFDVVVTDLEMPRVDGQMVVRAAREHVPDACVVVVTGRAAENCDDLVNAGACIVADKPFDYNVISRAVCDCRARGGPGAHGRCHMRSRPKGEQLVTLRRK